MVLGIDRRLFAAIAAILVLFCAVAVVRWNIWTYGGDLGIFAQATSNAFHGFTDGPEAGTHFRYHWSPILALLWPLVAVTHSALSLQFAQVVLIAFAAVPLAAIVGGYADQTWAFRAGVLALIYPPLISGAFLEFHELAFFPVLALALMWAADRARWGWFALFATASVLVREDATLDLVVLGLTLGVIGVVRRASSEQTGMLAGQPREPRRLAVAGFALAALSAGTLAFYWIIVTARLGGWAPSHFYSYPFAHGPLQVALSPLTHPLDFARAVFTFGRFTYLLEAFAPLALLPLATRWTALAFPALAELLLSSVEMAHRMGYEYELLWAPWLLLAAAWALVRLRETRSEQVARRWWIAAMTICAIVLLAFDPMHPQFYLTKQTYQDTADAQRAFACVPHDAPVATHDQWYPHVALAYPNATEMLGNVGQFKGYIVYNADWKNGYFESAVLPQLDAAVARGTLHAVCRFGDVVVLSPPS